MKLPTFKYEKEIWTRGYKYIAGIDEVGRGCFAGPVVAATCVFRKNQVIKQEMLNGAKINDSKKLTKLQREKTAKWIKENALWGIGEASASIINRVGIVKATQIAFRKAIKMANGKSANTVDYLLIDAFYIPYVKSLRRKNQLAIVKGDSKSISIAAASIIAKVYRDHLMDKVGKRKRYRKYKWEKNKGYGTKEHLLAIQKYGTNGYHRKQFVQTYLKKLI